MRLTTITGVGVCGLLLACAAIAQDDRDATGQSAEAIRACATDNVPRKTMVQDLLLESVNHAGNSRRITAKLYYKRFENKESRTTLQVGSPIDLSGTSYLMIDTADSDQLYLYLPSVEQVKRVTGGGAAKSMLGTDFSYEDMKQVRAMSAGGKLERMADDKLEGRAVHTVALTPPAGEKSAYERVVFEIDQKTCVPLQVLFFETGDKLTKRYTADPASLARVGDYWLAKKATMHDVGDGTQTRLTVESAAFDEEVSDTIFNRRTFYLGANAVLLPGAPNAA